MTSPLRRQDGFTLIELLVVVLIIGVLAAIALPSLLGQQDKARDATTAVDVRNGVSQVEACNASVNDYRSCTASNTEVKLAPGVSMTEVAADAYTLSATSGSRPATVFRAVRSASGLTRSCTQPAQGACRTGGSW